jgi:hypothetical protein
LDADASRKLRRSGSLMAGSPGETLFSRPSRIQRSSSLTSKYAQRSEPHGLFAKLTATVENTMRAGKLPVQAITGTMSVMDSAAKVMKGLAAAGQAVVDEAIKAAEETRKPEFPKEAESGPSPDVRTLPS